MTATHISSPSCCYVCFRFRVVDDVKPDRDQLSVEAHRIRVPALSAVRQRGLHAWKPRAKPVRDSRAADVRGVADLLRLRRGRGAYERLVPR